MPATDDLQDTCQSTLQPALTGLSGPGAIAFVAGPAGQRACISIAVAHQGLITLVLSSAAMQTERLGCECLPAKNHIMPI